MTQLAANRGGKEGTLITQREFEHPSGVSVRRQVSQNKLVREKGEKGLSITLDGEQANTHQLSRKAVGKRTLLRRVRSKFRKISRGTLTAKSQSDVRSELREWCRNPFKVGNQREKGTQEKKTCEEGKRTKKSAPSNRR